MLKYIFVSLTLLFVLVTNIHADIGFALSNATKLDTFSPRIDNIAPNTVLVGENKVITITGKGFSDGITLKIGQWTASNVNVINAQRTKLTAAVPSGGKGTFDIVVENPNGTSYTKRGGITYESSTALFVQPASGTVDEAVTLTGTNFDANKKAGNLTIDGQMVTVYAVEDTTVSGNDIYADESGEFVVKFLIPKIAGGFVALAVGDAETTLEIKAKINVSPESGRAGTSITLTGEGFGKSERVKIDFGSTKNIEEVTSRTDGSFEASFQLDAQIPGEKLIAARGAASNLSATTSFELMTSIPNSVAVSASRTTLIADDSQKTTITASVKDSGGRVVIGVDVTLETDLGSVTSPATDNKDGTYTATYTAAKKIGKATVTATSNGRLGDVKITLIPGPASTVEVVAAPDELSADDKSQSTITITVKDKNNNPIDNALVEMEASAGEITSLAEHQSDGNYNATYTAGRTEGKVTITATASGLDGTETVHYAVEGKTEITLTETSLTLEPTTGPVGTKVTVTGEGFGANADIGKLTINSVETSVFGVGETVVIDESIRANKDGVFVVTFLVSKQPGGGVIVAVGDAETRFVITAKIYIDRERGPVGTSVTVTGEGFARDEPIKVDFGDTKEIATERTTSDGSFEVTFEADAQAFGAKQVVATGLLSDRTAEVYFELTPPVLQLHSVSPTSGQTKGGEEITLTGYGFVDGATVTIGGEKVTDVVVVSKTEITAKTPPHTLGKKRVIVTDPDGNSSADEIFFEYISGPPLLTLNPPEGHIRDAIDVHGENYPQNTNVGQLTLDGEPAVAISPQGEGEVISNNEIKTSATGTFTVRVLVPKRPGGQMEVKVEPANAYFKILPQISISPKQGSAGTKIIVDGTGFAPEDRVYINFGATENITTGDADSDGKLDIEFEADQQTPGMLDVVARGVLFDHDAKATFEYIVLKIVDISPKNAHIEGEKVTITGNGFVNGTIVTIGGKEATDIQVNQEGTVITAKTPEIGIRELLDDSEPRDVRVTNPDGRSDTLATIFNYYLLYTFSLVRGWNLISFPGDVIEPTPAGFFGADITIIQDTSGETLDAFKLGEGYWVLAIEGTSREVKLLPKEMYTRSVKRGWNFIGSAYGVACMPEGVTQLFRWNANAETKNYESASQIEWGIGYWALVLKDSEITVDGRKPCHLAPLLQKSNIPPLWTLPIQLIDVELATTTRLTIGINSDANPPYPPLERGGFDSRFDVALPPPPPGEELPKAALLLDGDFDTWFRYASHSTGATQSKDFPLRLTKQILPVPKTGASQQFLLQVANNKNDAVLSWDEKQFPDDWSLSLIDQTRLIDMAKQSTYSLPKGKRDIVLVVNQKLKQPLPKSDALLQNYPNPFNPETWIPFALAENAEVVITIYDLKGRLVKKLDLGRLGAGSYVSKSKAAGWDGRNEQGERVASGVYIYQMIAGRKMFTRRMVILK